MKLKTMKLGDLENKKKAGQVISKNMPQAKLRITMAVFVVLAFFVGGGIAATYYASNGNDTIGRGVEISGILVSGLTGEEARNIIENNFPPPAYISIMAEDNEYVIPVDSEYIYLEVDKSIEHAVYYSIIENELRWFPEPLNISIPIIIDQDYLTESLRNISNSVNRAPADASIVLEDGRPVLINDQPGIILSIDDAVETINNSLANGQYKNIPVEGVPVPAATKAEDLPDITMIMASSKTPLLPGDENRTHNISLALDKINGLILEPGEEFSYNTYMGPASKENGYLEAEVIVNREIVQGYGGGVCQAATSIYRTALMAGIEIIERHPHSIPIEYAPLGQDAAVNYGLQDLQIKNTLSFPITFLGELDGEHLYLYLYGKMQHKYTVNLVTEIEETYEPDTIEFVYTGLRRGEREILHEGKKGYKVNLYRVIHYENQILDKIKVSTSTYNPKNTIIRVGQ